VRTPTLWLWIWVLAGCASGEATDSCGERGPCPRGQICVIDTCRVPITDAGPLDARLPDAQPLDMQGEDAAADAALDARVDAQIDAAADASPDAGADAVADAALTDAGEACEPGTARDCGRNIGLCRTGRQVCQEGRWGACEGGVQPRDDVCNGADDDCNGTIDDGFEVGGACDGLGVCGMGRVECRNTVITRCSTEPGGSMDQSGAERCNGEDDDCDGSTDEALGTGDGCQGACGAGTRECAADQRVVCSTDEGGSAYSARAEACNGGDDDCDGRVDEGFPVGMACDGRGICGAGTRECDGAGGVRCSTERGGSADQSVNELCNGQDDDCDGQPDNGLNLGMPCQAAGICGMGRFECGAMGALRCSTQPGGSMDRSAQEICNRQDDDCDGDTDEGFMPAPEGCNGRDDDCDGIVDEGAACGGETCENAPPLALYATELGATGGLANDYDRSTCTALSPGRDQVYRLNVPAAGDYTVGVAPLEAGYDPLFWIASACGSITSCTTPSAGANRQAPGRPEARTIAIPRGGEFFLVIDSLVDLGGGDLAASIAPFAAGERCGTAIALTLPARFVGTTEGRADDVFGNQCPAGWAPSGPDQAFRIELAAPTRVRVRVQPTATSDPMIQIVSDCAQVNATCAGGVNNRLVGGEETLEAQLAAGTWYIVVDHVQAPGPFLLTAEALP
jgi:hypothetical protein